MKVHCERCKRYRKMVKYDYRFCAECKIPKRFRKPQKPT